MTDEIHMDRIFVGIMWAMLSLMLAAVLWGSFGPVTVVALAIVLVPVLAVFIYALGVIGVTILHGMGMEI